MRKTLLIATMASFCVFYGIPGQAEEQREEKAFPALRVVTVEGEEGRTHSLMLGEQILSKDEGSHSVKINSIFNFSDTNVVVMEEYSGGISCPLQFYFVTIPHGYSPKNSIDTTLQMETGPWWKVAYQTAYHWIMSLIGIDASNTLPRIAAAESPIGTQQEIVISERFGSCSDLFSLLKNDGYSGKHETLAVFMKGYVGPNVASEDVARLSRGRAFYYVPGSSNVQEQYLK